MKFKLLICNKCTLERKLNEYPLYEIKSLQPQYVNFFSTVTNADESHKATQATVIINNTSEQRTIHLRREFFGWKISSDQPDYGINVPNNLYFVEMSYESIGKAVDIDNHIIDRKYWVIPNEKGNNYERVGDDENWYYSLKHCKNIYKTKDGKVYVFNKEKSDWEEANKYYSDLCYFGNYDEVDKKYAMEILEKYSSYREK